MAIVPCTRKRASSAIDTVQQLATLLRHDFMSDLNASLLAATLPASTQSSVHLKILGQICIDTPDSLEAQGKKIDPSIYLGSIEIHTTELLAYLHEQSTTPVVPGRLANSHVTAEQTGITHEISPTAKAVQSQLAVSDSPLNKFQKTNGGLRMRSGNEAKSGDYSSQSQKIGSTVRQLQTKTREFPQRKRKSNPDAHKLQPSSAEKFISGVWLQIYSNVKFTSMSLDDNCVQSSMSGLDNIEAFRAINSLCLKVTTMARCSRSLETIVQAHWVDCFESRVKQIAIEKPFLSNTETRMVALRQACTILQWSEKELRNKLAIWRGYKEIKDAGGWVYLVFAGSGIYRFCKYREGFANCLPTRLKRVQSSLEVAADSIHPEWRKLLSVIGVESQPAYTEHPHDWVVCDAAQPVTLKSTYSHSIPDFEFMHLEDSVLDNAAWGTEDPRITAAVTDGSLCNECGYFQSNSFSVNECRCYPELYGSCKTPVPVQVFRTPEGKNNGLIARCRFARGSSIGEFVGLITKGLAGIDVMQSGSPTKQYQIYQGRMGNYTRFINHSCAPNSQFQKFTWLGTERILLVSKGIDAGEEITVDYSHEYWEGLDKKCLCGEACCRYVEGAAPPSG